MRVVTHPQPHGSQKRWCPFSYGNSQKSGIHGSISALFGSLTHFATGPAPIYFGAGYIPQGTWWRLGFIMSMVNLIVFIGIGGLWWKLIGLL